jgi:hypothetical protein
MPESMQPDLFRTMAEIVDDQQGFVDVASGSLMSKIWSASIKPSLFSWVWAASGSAAVSGSRPPEGRAFIDENGGDPGLRLRNADRGDNLKDAMISPINHLGHAARRLAAP